MHKARAASLHDFLVGAKLVRINNQIASDLITHLESSAFGD